MYVDGSKGTQTVVAAVVSTAQTARVPIERIVNGLFVDPMDDLFGGSIGANHQAVESEEVASEDAAEERKRQNGPRTPAIRPSLDFDAPVEMIYGSYQVEACQHKQMQHQHIISEVIAFGNAGPQPWTVMIKLYIACITLGTM